MCNAILYQSPLDQSHPIQVPVIKGFEKNTQIFETHLNWIHWIRKKRPYKWRTLNKDTITHEDSGISLIYCRQCVKKK